MLSKIPDYIELQSSINSLISQKKSYLGIKALIRPYISESLLKSVEGVLGVLDNELKQLEKQNIQLNRVFKKLPIQRDLEDLERKLTGHSGTVSSIEASGIELKSQMSNLSVETTVQSTELQGKLNELTSLYETDTRQLRLEVTQFVSEIKALKRELGVNDSNIKELRQKITSQDSDLKLFGTLKDFKVEETLITNKIEQLKNKLSDLQLKYTDLVGDEKKKMMNLVKSFKFLRASLVNGEVGVDYCWDLETNSTFKFFLGDYEIPFIKAISENYFLKALLLKEEGHEKEINSLKSKLKNLDLLSVKRKNTINIMKNKLKSYQVSNQSKVHKLDIKQITIPTQKKSLVNFFKNENDFKDYLRNLINKIIDCDVPICFSGYLQQRIKNKVINLLGKVKQSFKNLIPSLENILTELKISF
jgi:predicted  nucleic acid-binding Zn-ribbon protein